MGRAVGLNSYLAECVYTDRYYAYQRRKYKQNPTKPEILVREIIGGNFLGGFTYKAAEEVETRRRFYDQVMFFRPLTAMEVIAWAAK